MKDTLSDILIKKKDSRILPFLQSLSQAERRNLAPQLKKLIREYTTYEYDEKKGSSSIKGSYEQHRFLSVAAFVCFNLKEYKQYAASFSYMSDGTINFNGYWKQDQKQKLKINDLLDWYCPDWLSDYLNDSKTNEIFLAANYEELMRWEKKGYITLSPELIATALYCVSSKEILSLYPETLTEHIWLLFSYPTAIHQCGNRFPESWVELLKRLSNEDKIDRRRLLTECMLTANRNFNKPLTNWFIEVLDALSPTNTEITDLQNEVLAMLNAAQSKPVNRALDYLKRICQLPSFQAADFISSLPVLITSATKSIVTGTLDIAGKLSDARPELAPEITLSLCGGFISKDESVQKKLARLISKYGKQELLKDQLSLYTDVILQSVKPLLGNWLEQYISDQPTDTSLPEPPPVEERSPIRNDNRIAPVDTFEEFLFFAGQAFDNNAPWHVFMLPGYLNRFDQEITSGNVEQLEPLFKKVQKTIDTWANSLGLIDRTMAAFFISYGQLLAKRFPHNTTYIHNLCNSNESVSLANWQSKINHTEIYPLFYLLLRVFNGIKEGKYYDLLSTPTHQPVWIDPVVLVQRLINLQDREEEPYSLDLQLAIQRCALHHTSEALTLADKGLKEEIRDLMIYLLDPHQQAKEDVAHPALWMTAAMTKHPHSVPAQREAWSFQHISPGYLTVRPDWDIRTISGNANRLWCKYPDFYLKNKTDKVWIAEYAFTTRNNSRLWSGDISRLINLAPYNHDHYLMLVMSDVGNYATLDAYTSDKLLTALEALKELALSFSETNCLFLALSFLCPNKAVKQYAAAIWNELVNLNLIPNTVLGRKAGEFVKNGWVPLKRLTELLENGMINTSSLHNRELQVLIEALLLELDNKTVSNLKKLLEIYNELLILNKTQPATEVATLLNTRAGESSLKKIIKQILLLQS